MQDKNCYYHRRNTRIGGKRQRFLFLSKKICYNVLEKFNKRKQIIMKRKLRKDKQAELKSGFDRYENIVQISSVIDLEDELENFNSLHPPKYKKYIKKAALIAIGVLVILSVAFLIYDRTAIYSDTITREVYEVVGISSSQFEDFAGGIIKYGRDGAVYFDYKGEEIWNQGYQISSPIIEITDKSVAIADSGGNNIYVFDEEGFKGQIETNLPIEKFSVSEQGVVAVLVKGDDSSQVICYDAVGTVLVEHSVSSSGMGYPTDIAISADGNMLLVTYLQIVDGEIVGKIAYYDFDKTGTLVSDYMVAYEERTGVVIPTAYFVNDKTSVVVTDLSFLVFEGEEEPQLVVEIDIEKEIQSVCYEGDKIAFLLAGESTQDNELRVYDTSGTIVMSVEYEGQYSNVKMQGNQVLMYEGNQCKIFTMYGKEKFSGELDGEILSITKIFGVNKYIVIENAGMIKVQLRK